MRLSKVLILFCFIVTFNFVDVFASSSLIVNEVYMIKDCKEEIEINDALKSDDMGIVYQQEADEVNLELLDLTITSEFEAVSTFDTSKNISGKAPVGTKIVISVSEEDSLTKEYNVSKIIDIEVGVSEIFRESICLNLGNNKVLIEATKEGFEIFEQEIIINRKSEIIKNQLKNTIFIPGSF